MAKKAVHKIVTKTVVKDKKTVKPVKKPVKRPVTGKAKKPIGRTILQEINEVYGNQDSYWDDTDTVGDVELRLPFEILWREQILVYIFQFDDDTLLSAPAKTKSRDKRKMSIAAQYDKSTKSKRSMRRAKWSILDEVNEVWFGVDTPLDGTETVDALWYWVEEEISRRQAILEFLDRFDDETPLSAPAKQRRRK